MDADMYERALTMTSKVVSGTSREQLDDPTPCPDWRVRELLNHIISGCKAVAAGGRGETEPFGEVTGHVGDDHVKAFEEASREAVAVFRPEGALDKTYPMSWGDSPGSAVLGLAIADAVVHGWDLAQATRQHYEIDEEIAEAVYGMTSSMMEPNGKFPRGDSFAAPVEVPDDAPARDRMLAYLGRRP